MLREDVKCIITTLKSDSQSTFTTRPDYVLVRRAEFFAGIHVNQQRAYRRSYLEAVDEYEKQCFPHFEKCRLPCISMGQFGK
jgi:hypothetical protein